MRPWLAVVGLSEAGFESLTPVARTLIDDAEVLVGGARHLAMVNHGTAERLTWQTPLSRTVEAIAERRGHRVTVLATGDPMWFGIGVTLVRRFAGEDMIIVPHLSAFSMAAARLGWPLAEVETLTLHGRPLDLLALHLAPGARLLILSENGETPAAVARFLTERGWGPSQLTVLEHLDGTGERRVEGTAANWPSARMADLNTIALTCVADKAARVLSRAAGLPDDAFRHDGQLTKREVRAATLAALSPLPGQLLWDVGAGCGSVAIEWMRLAPRATAIAIEREAGRRTLIAANAAALGTPRLMIIAGEAPVALAGLERPDAIFIGGGLSSPGLVDACWSALKPGGRLVANAVTVEGESALIAAASRLRGTLTRLAVSRAEAVGGFHAWRALMAVTQLSANKA